MKNLQMPITDIWAKTFQICWVTNDIDQAMELLKEKFDIPDFMVMRDVPLEDLIYEGMQNDDAKMNACWARCGTFDLELIQPTEGYLLDFYGEQLAKDRFDMTFHHFATRFDNDLDGYNRAVDALKAKGFNQRWAAGIKDLTKFCYFDLREFFGHHLELIYFNAEGVKAMKSLETGDFDGE